MASAGPLKAARGDPDDRAAQPRLALLHPGGADGTAATERTAAVIDLGSNSWRLVVLADVGAAAVRNLALQRGADMPHAEHVARLALQLFDSLVAEGVLVPAEDERALLAAAALLHDIGLTIGYGGHPGHSHYMILKSELTGYGPRELALLAQIVRYHRKGTPTLDELRPLTRDGDAELLARCALLLRLAEQLDSGQDQSVRAAQLLAERRALRLQLRGEDRLARWSIERGHSDEPFRRAFGRRLVVTP